jgi:hypothetical protein
MNRGAASMASRIEASWRRSKGQKDGTWTEKQFEKVSKMRQLLANRKKDVWFFLLTMHVFHCTGVKYPSFFFSFFFFWKRVHMLENKDSLS